MDFHFAADEFDGDGFKAFPNLAVVEGEAVAADPAGRAGFEDGFILPIAIKRGQSEAC